MIKQKIKIKNKALLNQLMDSNLILITYTNPCFDSIKIRTDKFKLIIYNQLHEAEFLGENDEITYFKLEKENGDSDFLLNDTIINEIKINEKIEAVYVVTDIINYNDEYQIDYDMGIIFKTKSHEYIISRDWHYMETMHVNIDKNFDDILPIKQEIEAYNNDDKAIKVSIKRTIKRI